MALSAPSQHACPVCDSIKVRVLIDIPRIPIHCNLLWKSCEEAVDAPRGEMRLAFCDTCGHVFNASFDPGLMEYTQAYENSLHFSPRFQEYAERLADRLIDGYGIRNTEVIDIGCGKGDFLALLCERGENKGYGFDPSFVPENLSESINERMTIIQDFYSSKYAHYHASLVTCRHVLEHIRFPREFLCNVRNAVGEGSETIVFFEVPNVLFTLKDLGIWDLIYEHCSYFSVPSLKRAFTQTGFEVLDVVDLYGGQFLGIDTKGAAVDHAGDVPPSRDDVAEISGFANTFAESYTKKVGDWQEKFAELESSGSSQWCGEAARKG